MPRSELTPHTVAKSDLDERDLPRSTFAPDSEANVDLGPKGRGLHASALRSAWEKNRSRPKPGPFYEPVPHGNRVLAVALRLGFFA